MEAAGPDIIRLWEPIARDLGRCGGSRGERVRELISNPGMWAVVEYRFRRWVYYGGLPAPVRVLFAAVSRFSELWIRMVSNIELPTAVPIGEGLYIPHTGFIVVAKGTRIGRNCTLTQGVTLGHAGGGRSAKSGAPVLGDRVYVGPSASIIGPVEVGSDALIGVGAVVVRSVPEGGVAVGNPAKILSTQGSFDLIDYPAMESDQERLDAIGRLRPGSRPPPAPACPQSNLATVHNAH